MYLPQGDVVKFRNSAGSYESRNLAHFGGAWTKIGIMQRRLAWPFSRMTCRTVEC